MGKFIPTRSAAWAVLSNWAGTLAARYADAASADAVPGSIGAAAEADASVAARLARHMPPHSARSRYPHPRRTAFAGDCRQ
jgi:hypothetical protein